MCVWVCVREKMEGVCYTGSDCLRERRKHREVCVFAYGCMYVCLYVCVYVRETHTQGQCV